MRFLGLLLFFLVLVGCTSEQQPLSQAGENDEVLSAHGTVGGEVASEPAAPLKGKVLERIDADRYSYLRLSTESGEIWAAVLRTEVQAGEEVIVVNPMPMDGFESPTLNRTFDRIMFGTLTDEANTKRMLMDAHSGVSEAADVGLIQVDKASGPDGRTVAEIFAQKQNLKDRKVAVRGKVTKVNSNILSRTWIHIQDGTGDPQAETHELVVTSQDSPSVGDTVLVEGVIRTDKNYGLGYVYPVILEDAVVTKQ
jgi:hypothetical protein